MQTDLGTTCTSTSLDLFRSTWGNTHFAGLQKRPVQSRFPEKTARIVSRSRLRWATARQGGSECAEKGGCATNGDPAFARSATADMDSCSERRQFVLAVPSSKSTAATVSRMMTVSSSAEIHSCAAALVIKTGASWGRIDPQTFPSTTISRGGVEIEGLTSSACKS